MHQPSFDPARGRARLTLAWERVPVRFKDPLALTALAMCAFMGVALQLPAVPLPPAMISLPFKLLLFVLVDGWSLIVQSLVTSFR